MHKKIPEVPCCLRPDIAFDIAHYPSNAMLPQLPPSPYYPRFVVGREPRFGDQPISPLVLCPPQRHSAVLTYPRTGHAILEGSSPPNQVQVTGMTCHLNDAGVRCVGFCPNVFDPCSSFNIHSGSLFLNLIIYYTMCRRTLHELC